MNRPKQMLIGGALLVSSIASFGGLSLATPASAQEIAHSPDLQGRQVQTVNNAACNVASAADSLGKFLQGIGVTNYNSSDLSLVLGYASDACGCVGDLESAPYGLILAPKDCGSAFSTIINVVGQYFGINTPQAS